MRLILNVLRCPPAVIPETRILTGGEFSLGRGPGVDWVLSDVNRMVSRRHCMLAFRSGEWHILDNSANGTFANNDDGPIGKGNKRVLRDHDRLHIGPYEIEVLLDQGVRPGDPGPAFAGQKPGVPHDDPFGDPLWPDDSNASFLGRTQVDHSSVLDDAIYPPSPIEQLSRRGGGPVPADDLLPEGWDRDLLPSPVPATSGATQPEPIFAPRSPSLQSPPQLLGKAVPKQETHTGAATTRTIDANFFADRFAAGEMATLTITIRLPQNPVRGKWQSKATFDPELGPIQIILEAQGFTLVSELPPPFDVPKDSDTAPVAFELRIEEATHRWIHVLLFQKGRSVGELTINDFSAVGQVAAQQIMGSAVRSIAEADLMLVVRAAEGRIEACSPSDRASLDHVPMTGFKYPEIPFRELLADRLRALYDTRSDPAETARELQIVGVELAACLPADLAKLLRRCDIQSAMLRHEDDFDFPLELCYLDDPNDPFFVGDRIAVCRWYLGVTSPPDIVSKRVRMVAFLKGSDKAFEADEKLLNRLYPDRTVTFRDRNEIVNKLFKTSDFDLIHFTGHCREQDKASGGLELADGTFLGPADK